MKNYQVDPDKLKEFSNSLPYGNIPSELEGLFHQLNQYKEKFHFPAIHNDIGSLLSMFVALTKPKTIFEMGSGYGHSAFWFLLNGRSVKEIALTEKREDLEESFKALPWPSDWKDKLRYYQDDAFKIVENYSQIDMALIDGVKADYLRFLNILENKISDNGVVFIDNSYWRGSFLDEEVLKTKKSAQNIRELHDFIKDSDFWEAIFVPYVDGLTILKKK